MIEVCGVVFFRSRSLAGFQGFSGSLSAACFQDFGVRFRVHRSFQDLESGLKVRESERLHAGLSTLQCTQILNLQHFGLWSITWRIMGLSNTGCKYLYWGYR